MQRIAMLNQKGGVGKTTTSVNLAVGLSRLGCKVCLADLDPQAHATTHLGVAMQANLPTLYHALVGGKPLSSLLQKHSEHLYILPADLNLAAAEVELAGVVGRELILKDQFDLLQTPEGESFDWVIMDCGPSLGILTLNALSAARDVIIPLQPHFLALHGMGKLLETTSLVSKRLNPGLRVLGILLSMYEANTKLAQEVTGDLVGYLEKARGSRLPWADAKVFQSKIRRNIKLAEAPGFGQSIFDYEPNSNGADDYGNLCKEIVRIIEARDGQIRNFQSQDFQGQEIPTENPVGPVHPSHELAPPSSLSHHSAPASAQSAEAVNSLAFASEEESWQNP